MPAVSVPVPFIAIGIAGAWPVAVPVIQVRDRVVLLPAVFGALVAAVEVHVALAPYRLAVLLAIMGRLLPPPFREPLLPVLVKLPLLLKAV